MSILKIDKSHIKALNDEMARELVARLCRAELREQGMPESEVTWGGDQRASDGGVDVRVDSPVPLVTPKFIKRACTVLQVKAEKFPSSKIRNEMAPSGALRPAIMELSKKEGSYLIVSTMDDTSDKTLELRRDGMRKCLKEHGIDLTVHYDFYDSRRVADWVEQYPAIVTWLRDRIGQPLNGWSPYGPWAYREDDVESVYHVDDRVRVFVQATGMELTIADAIGRLRHELQKPVSIRIVGLSGVGKTRLVQALFDGRVCIESEPPSAENVIYVDLANDPNPSPRTMLKYLLEQGSDAIVVVDNCGTHDHGQLSRLATAQGSLIKLITIEYDVREDLPEETLCYRLEGSSSQIIEVIVKERYPRLTTPDIRRIVEFSDGNARVALALASTVERGGELSELKDRALFERLFRQKNGENDELLRCAEAASLLYSFDIEDDSPEGEMELLVQFAGVTARTFVRHMAELKRRGLLQERGKWCAILPHAIANHLATRALEGASMKELHSILDGENDRVARSLCRRFGYLHESSRAVALAKRVLTGNGRLADLQKLSDMELHMLEYLAPLVPREMLEAIEQASQDSQFISIENRRRGTCVRIVHLIAYEAEYFSQAVSILKRFALVEPENYANDPARERLKALFRCCLSGTQASPEERIEWVKEVVSSTCQKERSLGLDLISEGLKTEGFVLVGGLEFGARRRGFGWRPRTEEELRRWFRPLVELIALIGRQENTDGDKARTVLGEAFPRLWGKVGIDGELFAIAERLKVIDGWPQGWLGVKRTMQSKEQLSPSSFEQLKKLEQLLEPSDLLTEIRARVLARSTRPWELDVLETGDIDNDTLSTSERIALSRVRAEQLGEEAALSSGVLETLIPDLSCSNCSELVFSFGRGVGKQHRNMTSLLDAIRRYLIYPTGGMNSIWVGGLIAGWTEKSPAAVEEFMDSIIEDAGWGKWFVELQIQAGLDEAGFERLLRAIDLGICPVRQYERLALGRRTDLLTVSQIMNLSEGLCLKRKDGLHVAIRILAMVISCTDRKDQGYIGEFAKSLLEFLCNVDWLNFFADDSICDYDIGVILRFSLSKAQSEEEVKQILSRLLATIQGDGFSCYSKPDIFRPFFQLFPRLSLDMICIPLLDDDFGRVEYWLSDSSSESRDTVVGVVPLQVLREWCDDDPETRYPFAAKVCELFIEGSKDSQLLEVSNVAITLLQRAPDKVAVVEAFASRLDPVSWSGSLADILEERLSVFDQLRTGHAPHIDLEIERLKREYQYRIKEEREAERERYRNYGFE